MNNNIKYLALSLIIVETLMIGYAYWHSVGLLSLGVASIYLILALSDMIVKTNKLLSKFVIFVSIFISIPRAIVQIDETINIGRQAEIENILSRPLPEKRVVEVSLLDCSRIPYWQGNLQIECSTDNNRQIDNRNKAELEYKEKVDRFNLEKEKSLAEVNNTYIRYLNLKNISTILLIVFITPILPIVVILLIHTKHTEPEIANTTERIVRQKKKRLIKSGSVIDDTLREKAISMLKLGYTVKEIQDELGISKPTLYRYKKKAKV